MKAERPPHHTPVMRDDVPVTGGDDITECMKKLTLENVTGKSKNTYNILVDETKNEEDTTQKNNKKDVKIEEKDNEKKAQVVSTKCSPKKDEIKEKEKKPEVKEEPLGELCARGPEPKSKWASQTRASALPYFTHPQSNPTLTNGGRLYCIPQQTQLSSEICYPDSSISQTTELAQEYHFTQQNSLDNNQFSNNICEISTVYEGIPCPEFQMTPQSPAKLETQSDPDVVVKEMIREIVSDPIKTENMVKDLLKSSSDLAEVQNPPLSKINLIPYESYGNVSPNSSPQVVPKSQLSPYSTSSGSPLGPSSPNLYANTPTFSPNIPSPRGYPSDDSNHMYTPTPYYNSMLSPQMQRPLSSCSSTSSTTNQSYSEPDPIDLNAICFEEPPEEGKRLELKFLEQELDNTCSQACSNTEALNIPTSLPVNNVPLTNSPVVITTIIAAQSPTMMAPTSNGSNQGVPRLRKILPKPSENTMTIQQGEAFLAQNLPCRQHVNHNRMVRNQKKPHCTAKDQLLERCSQEKIKRNWAIVNSLHDDDIAKVDEDGDTCLMILACDKEVTNKPEQLYALVERCKQLPDVLCARNNEKLSALDMACMAVSHDPLVATYIAEAMIEVNADLSEVGHEGSTVIHLLCKAGDKSAELLNQLLSLRDSKGKPCFDINKNDYEGRSPLHLAVETHNRDVPCLEIVKVLLKNGVDVLKKDGKQGSTPLHFALATAKADPNLINTLCNTTRHKYELVNALNYKDDTPLHVAMACGGSIDQQTHNCILECLMAAGASRAIRNQNGKAPLELAPEQRKVEIKKILDKYNVK